MHFLHKKKIIQNSDKTSMQLATVFSKKVIIYKTSQEQLENIFFTKFWALSCNDRAVCRGLSRNLFNDFTKNCNFERSLV